MELAEVEARVEKARMAGASEILVMSGERLNEMVPILEAAGRLGFHDFIDYVAAVCRMVLAKGLLPHTNIGCLSESELNRLRPYNASMGLMLENADRHIGERIHPQKDMDRRMETLIGAGRLQIPFTTGILVGLGESQASRLASLQVIADLHRQFGHIQEIILQNYVPNEHSTLPEYPLSPLHWEELISFTKEAMPEVKIQIPPNLNPDWAHWVHFGVHDLGGISPEKDFVNPGNPWKAPSAYRAELEPRGFSLWPRLPLYRKYYQKGWVPDAVRTTLDLWVKRHEFRYYCR